MVFNINYGFGEQTCQHFSVAFTDGKLFSPS